MTETAKFASFLKNLDQSDKQQLLRELLAGEDFEIQGARLPGVELAKAEEWLWKRIDEARDMRQKNSRLRIWLIFMLLRYGGLRLREIFNLKAGDMDFGAGLVHVQAGQFSRDAPLAPHVNQKIRIAWQNWYETSIRQFPLKCDSGFVRRTFQDCARACQLPEGTLNARSMRRNRGRELELAGARGCLADIFLGRLPSDKFFVPQNAAMLLKELIHGRNNFQTSARNVFLGRVKVLEAGPILVRLCLETPEKLLIRAIITRTSVERLKLREGMEASAMIKAPWVGISATMPEQPPANCFVGKMEKINQDAEATEILASLPEGYHICSLLPGRSLPPAPPGSSVHIYFEELAVIITL